MILFIIHALIAATVGYFLFLPLITWGLYLAVMSLKRAEDSSLVSDDIRPLAVALLWFGLFSDFMLNLTWGTVLFLELPQLHKKELLLSPRVARLKRSAAGYRLKLAAWVCTRMLDPYDPSGCHCK